MPAPVPRDEINMDRVVEILTGPLGIVALIDHAGSVGGVARIYAGPNRGGRYAAMAGPGSYGWGRRASIAEWDDFRVGPDFEGVEGIPVADVGGIVTELGVAVLIAAQTRKPDPSTALSYDEIEAIGFDVINRRPGVGEVVDQERSSVYIAAANASDAQLAAAGVPAEDRLILNDRAGREAVQEWEAGR